MADHRTRRQKLEAMANQTASPHEAEVARRMLAKLGHEAPRQQQGRPADAHYRWGADTATDADYTVRTETYWDYATGTYRVRFAQSNYNTSYSSNNANMSYQDILRWMRQQQAEYEAEVRKAKYAEYERRKTAEAPSSREEAEKPHWWDAWREHHDPEAAEAAQRRRWETEAAQQRRWAEGRFYSTDEFKRWYQNEVKRDPERG